MRTSSDHQRDQQAANPSTLIEGLRSDGYVLMRGLHPGDDGFVTLTEQLSERFSCDPAKLRGSSLQRRDDRLGDAARAAARFLDKMPGKLASRRSNGTRSAPFQPYGINPHNENSYIPGAFPELVWFHCDLPAQTGGETLLCDGVEVLQRLSDRAREFVEAEPVHYELAYSTAQWQNLYDFDDPTLLAKTLDAVDNLTWSLDDRNKLSYVFDAAQVGSTIFGGEPALRTNVLSRRPFAEVGEVEGELLRNGEAMPEWFISELLHVVDDVSISVSLDAGDVIVIDNSRVMHGRAPFEGTERRVLTRCGFLRPEFRPG